MKVEPVTLIGRYVQLEPMRLDHLPGLIDAGLDESLWKLTANIVKQPSDIERYVNAALP